MARKRKTPLDDLAKLIVIGLFSGYVALASFWNGLTPEWKLFFGILVPVTLLIGIAFVVAIIQYRKHLRRQAWEAAMKAWAASVKDGKSPQYQSARNLSANGLEKFAAQVYKKMGYRVVHTGQSGDHGVDVHLVNPNNQVELVQCKQWNKPVGEPEVRDLMGAMIHEKALRGVIWAPGGFSASAMKWATGKPIILADNEEIGRIVESAYLN